MRGFYDASKDGKVPTTKNIVWPEIIVAPKDTTNKKRHLLIIAPAEKYQQQKTLCGQKSLLHQKTRPTKKTPTHHRASGDAGTPC